MRVRLVRAVMAATGALAVCAASAQLCGAQTSFPKQFVTPQLLIGVNGSLIGVGDLNGDGRPDILYQNSASIATGNGTFRSIAVPQNFDARSRLADVTGDGKLDVVVPVPADESCDYYPDGTPYCNINGDAFLKVFPGNGDGTFRTGTSLDLGQEGSGIAYLTVADLNGDDRADALLNFSGNPEDSASATSFVLINNGTGTFRQVGTTGFANVLTTGDFNKDGKTDVVVGGSGVIVYLGKGDGTFTEGPTVNGFFAGSAVAGDFNHDGRLDLAAADSTGQATTGIYILLAKSDGTFTPKRASTFNAGQLLSADLNHDGYLDLVAGSSSFEVLTNLKNGTFSPRVFNPESFSTLPMALADFNRDGYFDLVAGYTISYGTDGARFLTPTVTLSQGAEAVAGADFNRDGIDDVAVANVPGTVTVFAGSGGGYLNAGTTYTTGIQLGHIAAGDVNGDGIVDLVVTRNNSYTPGLTNDVSVLLGNGNGTFRPAINSKVLGQPAGYTQDLQTYAVDVNHDGKADLIGDWGIALGHGDGAFAKPMPFPAAAMPIAQVAVGDLNRDGNVDFVIGNYTQATIYTLLGNGHGGFTLSHQERLNYTTPRLLALDVADMNADNILDLVYIYGASPSTGAYDRAVVETGDGSGAFGNATGVRLPPNESFYNKLLIDDFNGDGKRDVVVLTVAGQNGVIGFGESAVLRGTGGGALSAPQYFPLQMTSGAVLDLDNNGAPDIVGPTLDQVGVARVLNTAK